MDLTQGTKKEKNDRARKMMLWFGIVSLLMGFVGWTSAYIVSSAREDWVNDISLPSSFFISTLVIIISSFTYRFAEKSISRDKLKQGTQLLLATLGLGITFIILQFNGFSEMIGQGYYFTGPTSSIKMSYVFLIAAVHIVHVVAGLVTLLVVITNHLKGRYSSKEMLGVELGATFWHFLDILWIYLILFMYFVK